MNSERLMAFVRLIVPLIVGAAAMFDWAVDADLMMNIAMSVLALVSFVWTWWKNNNVTEAAQEAQKLLDEIKQKGE